MIKEEPTGTENGRREAANSAAMFFLLAISLTFRLFPFVRRRKKSPSPIDTAVFHTPSETDHFRPSLSHILPTSVFLQLLLGCGGSPLFTLGTTYVDNHVKRDDSSMYIGIMYSMCAFGPVCGFLLGAYLLSHHVDTFTIDVAQMLIGECSDSDCPNHCIVSTLQKGAMVGTATVSSQMHRCCRRGRKDKKL